MVAYGDRMHENLKSFNKAIGIQRRIRKYGMFSVGHKYETLYLLCVIVSEPPVVQQTPIVIWIENGGQMAFSIFKETLYGNPSQCSLSISELTRSVTPVQFVNFSTDRAWY